VVLEALKNFLLADQCLGFMPRPSIIRQLAEGDLVEVPIEGLKDYPRFLFHPPQRDGGLWPSPATL